MKHHHPVNIVYHDQATFGQRAAEKMAKAVGSWRFLIVQSVLVALWISFNVWELNLPRFDVFPFVLLNLLFSIQAAYTGPILLIAANRSVERDRLLAEHDSEQIELEHQILTQQQYLLEQNTKLTKEVHQWVRALHDGERVIRRKRTPAKATISP